LNDDEKTGTTNWLRSHLAAIGSAAVLSVYAAGYVRTKAAAARVAGETPPPRRPVAHTPIAPAEIAQQPSPRPVDKKLGAAHANVEAAKASSSKRLPAKAHAASADTAKSAEVHPNVVAAPVVAAAAASPAPADTTPAKAPVSAQAADSTTHVAYKDGVYSGWGTSREGDIEATVDIRGGRIVAAMITQCLTRYSCSWISALPPQVVDRQSAEVDYVSGATESSNAFYGAVARALGKAK
jgi:uncharacterized protein with FMN-binding domain